MSSATSSGAGGALLRAAMLSALCMIGTLPASAISVPPFTVTAPSSYTVLYNGFDGSGGTVAGLSAQNVFTFGSGAFSGNTVTFTIDTLNTTTNATAGVDSRIVSFGFDTTPTVTNVSATGTFSGETFVGANITSGTTVEFCIFSGNNCQGGGNTGLTEGQSGLTTVSLTFNDNLSQFSFDNLFVRYQSVAALNGGSTIGTAVPEPGVISLIGVLCAGALAAMRKRRQQQQSEEI